MMEVCPSWQILHQPFNDRVKKKKKAEVNSTVRGVSDVSAQLQNNVCTEILCLDFEWHHQM